MHHTRSSAATASTDAPAPRAAALAAGEVLDAATVAEVGEAEVAGQVGPAPVAGVVGVVGERIEYFNAPYHHRPSAGPGMVLGTLGLGLIFLGGCFMVGLLIMHQNTDTDWSGRSVYIYLGALYLLAALCFAGAAVLMVLAVKSLLKAARG